MTLNVADISRYQAGIHEDVLKAGGCDAVIIGVTFGGVGANPYAADELNGTYAAGMLRGAYHIRAWGNWTPQQEADWFLANMGPYLDGRTILALDWEECDTSNEAWALEWLQYVEAKTGIKPWFYVNLADLLKYGFPRIAANGNAIWLAQYPYAACNGFAGVNWQPQAIPAGHTLAAWQYVGTGGAVNGISGLDLSVAYIDANGWLAYAAPNGATLQSGTITPIQEDDMSYSQWPQADRIALLEDIKNVLKPVQDRIPAGAARAAIPGIPRATDNGDIYDIRQDISRIPGAVLNQTLKLADGSTPTLASVVAAILAKPAGGVVNNAATGPITLDAAQLAQLAEDLKTALPAATLAAFRDQINKP